MITKKHPSPFLNPTGNINDIDRNVLCNVLHIKQCSKASQYMVKFTKQRHWNHQTSMSLPFISFFIFSNIIGIRHSFFVTTAFVMALAAGKLWDTISECISQIQSDCDDEAKERALQTLVSITKASPPHRNLVMQNQEAIPALLSLLKSSSRALERLSLSILFNLSLNPNLKSTLADMATIQHLNTVILSRGSLESSKLAASLICSLAMLDKNKAVFGVANTIQALLKGVSRPNSPVTHHLLSSLAELVHFHGNCTLAVRSGAVGVLLRIVENKDSEDLCGTALSILGLLAKFDEGLKALTNTPSIVSRMLDVLKGRSMLNNEGAAEVLLRVFDESEECLRDAIGLPDFMYTLAELSVRGSTRAREKASLLLRKLEANESYVDDDLVFLK
ncbi:U-box domain-containing protein 2 isoform X2 [Lactuca sativa]|nr:U-box domain-containing protein 2 isoform X2 [Lactuca sativa]